MNAAQAAAKSAIDVHTSMERLSTGFRVNAARDDHVYEPRVKLSASVNRSTPSDAVIDEHRRWPWRKLAACYSE